MARALVLLVCLPGCFEPISNSVFYEDAQFLAALPSEGRLLPPEGFEDATVGDSVMLDRAVAAHDTYWSLIRPALESGEALRNAAPASRTDTHRSWDPAPVAVIAPEGTMVWWTRGTVLIPEDGDTIWSIEVSMDQDGPFVGAGSGRHGEADGDFSWDMRSVGGQGQLAVGYDLGSEWGRNVHIEYIDIDVVVATDPFWGLHGQQVLSFTEDGLDLHESQPNRPGAAVAMNTSAGGRADGNLYVSSEALEFTECWDALGDRVYVGGDPGITREGDPAACVGEEVFGEPPAGAR